MVQPFFFNKVYNLIFQLEEIDFFGRCLNHNSFQEKIFFSRKQLLSLKLI